MLHFLLKICFSTACILKHNKLLSLIETDQETNQKAWTLIWPLTHLLIQESKWKSFCCYQVLWCVTQPGPNWNRLREGQVAPGGPPVGPDMLPLAALWRISSELNPALRYPTKTLGMGTVQLLAWSLDIKFTSIRRAGVINKKNHCLKGVICKNFCLQDTQKMLKLSTE